MSIIRVNTTLIDAMIADFELERQECLSILQGPDIAGSHERSRNRLSVINDSVQELRAQIADPERAHKQATGGYSNDELARFQQVQQHQYES